jgi:hypothetical protein
MTQEEKTPTTGQQDHPCWPAPEVVIQTMLTFLQAVVQNDLETMMAVCHSFRMDEEDTARLIVFVRYTFKWAQEQQKERCSITGHPGAEQEKGGK